MAIRHAELVPASRTAALRRQGPAADAGAARRWTLKRIQSDGGQWRLRLRRSERPSAPRATAGATIDARWTRRDRPFTDTVVEPRDPSTRPVELRLIGAPTDRHSSFLRGPALAPPLIRAALHSDHGNMTSESGIELGLDVELTDSGDLPLAEADGDDALIAAAVAEAAAAGAVPLVLGGDHSITVPIVEALAAAHGALDI